MSKMVIVNKKGLLVAAFFSIFLAAVFAVCGGLHSGFTTKNLLFFAGAGIFLGLIGAPELEPKSFRYPTLWQVSFAILGCVTLAASLDAPPEGYGLALIGGTILGYFAPSWIKYI
jgi:hypothetical protein